MWPFHPPCNLTFITVTGPSNLSLTDFHQKMLTTLTTTIKPPAVKITLTHRSLTLTLAILQN